MIAKNGARLNAFRAIQEPRRSRLGRLEVVSRESIGFRWCFLSQSQARRKTQRATGIWLSIYHLQTKRGNTILAGPCKLASLLLWPEHVTDIRTRRYL